jgi:hypothetical protein
MRDVREEGLQGIGAANELQEWSQREPVQQGAEFGTVGRIDSESVSVLPKVEDLLEQGQRDLAGTDRSDLEAGIEAHLQVPNVILNGRAGDQGEGALPNLTVGMPAEPPQLPELLHLQRVSTQQLLPELDESLERIRRRAHALFSHPAFRTPR